MNDSRPHIAGDAERWARLTDKQRACLDLLLERKTSKQIARVLDISKPTVDQRIAAARLVLGAQDRDEAALSYARLKATYDRVTYDPVQVPLPPKLLPSNFPDGDPGETSALEDGAFISSGSSASSPPFGDIWRPDHPPTKRVMMMAAMLVVVAILILVGLAIGHALTRLISG